MAALFAAPIIAKEISRGRSITDEISRGRSITD
jgi:hypothetical protein